MHFELFRNAPVALTPPHPTMICWSAVWAPASLFGNSAPYSILGPASFNWDAALFKHTDVTERIKLEVRMEAFDFLNHAYLSGLQTNISVPAQVGVATGRSDSRVVQFGARISF